MLGVAGIFSLAQMALFADRCLCHRHARLLFRLADGFWHMPIAALVTVIGSLIIGLACLRLRGPYVALLTLAIAQVLYLLIVNDTGCFTNPASGCMPLLWRRARLFPLRRPGLSRAARFEILCRRTIMSDWSLAALAMVFSILVIRGPLGLAFQALRDNPVYAMSRGISRFKYQLWVFGLSAFFTGLAGAFYAVQFGAVGPVVFSLSTLLFLLSMIVVGGMGTSLGAASRCRLLMLGGRGDARGRRLARYRPRPDPLHLRHPAATGSGGTVSVDDVFS